MNLKTILITALQRDETVGGVPLPPQHGGSWQVYGGSWQVYGGSWQVYGGSWQVYGSS